MRSTSKKTQPAEAPAQRELAAAPTAPAANDEARTAIATINTQLAEFDVVEAGLSDLEKTYTKVAYDCTVPKGLKDATEARLTIRKPRFAVEEARKAAKAPVLKLGRDIDARAAKITERLFAIETPIDDQIKAQERAEAARKQQLEERILEIQRTADQAIGKTSAQLLEIAQALASMPLEDFQEFKERAAAAITQAAIKVKTLYDQALQAEESQRILAEQRREKDRTDALKLMVQTITEYENTAQLARSSERLQALITRLQAVEIGPEYQEFGPAAREEKTRVQAALGVLLESKKAAEARALEAANAPAAHASFTVGGSMKPPVFGNTKDFGVFNDGVPMERPAGYASLTAEHANVGGPVGAAIAPATMSTLRAHAENVREIADIKSVALPDKRGALPDRPSHQEIIAHLAEHYDEQPGTVIGWLADIDAHALRDHFAFA